MIARVTTLLMLFSAAAGAQFRDIPPPDSAAVFDGVYVSTYHESIFSPCDVPGIGSGWWLRFSRERNGAFLVQHPTRAGMGTLAHFIRVRGRVSKPGHYGLGFQTREIVVDSVLDIQETVQPCASFEELPQPWSAAGSATIIGAAMTDDNAILAVHDLESKIRIWNVRYGKVVTQFQSDDKGELNWGSTLPMAFTHDGRRLAVGGRDGVVRVWDVASGRRLWTLQPSDSLDATVNGQKLPTASSGLAFNQSGTLLANMIIAGNTSIWSMVTGQRVGNHHGGYTGGGRVLFLGDTALLASSDSGRMQIFPQLGAAAIWNVGTPLGNLNVMDRSPDGRWLVLKSWGDTIYLWSLVEGRIAHTLVVPNWFLGSVAFSPDGKMIAAPGGANALYVWDVKTGEPLLSFQKYRMQIQKVWFTPDSRALVSYSMDDSVFKIVHLYPRTTAPTQPGWGAQSWPNPPPGVTLGSISGFVRDTANRPIVGVQISIFDGEHPGSAAIAKTETNAAGHYLVQKMRVRHIAIRASKPGYQTDEQYTHMSGHEAGLDFVLKPDSGQ